MQATISISCVDRRGIIAQISDIIFRSGGNILQSDQHATHKDEAGDATFYMRILIELPDDNFVKLNDSFEKVRHELKASIIIRSSNDTPKMGVLVSKSDHCLSDILYRRRLGELRVDIPFVMGNHKDCEKLTESYNIPFYHVDMKTRPKAEAEAEILSLTKDTDFLVLARFMQILSGDFLHKYQNDIINIHHSFLPSFKGAHPYRQAFERGVKLIGATAHFVTEDLDEGPIIEQAVERVTHRDTEDDLKRKGRNLEVSALASALRSYTEHKVIRHKNKTIVFG